MRYNSLQKAVFINVKLLRFLSTSQIVWHWLELGAKKKFCEQVLHSPAADCGKHVN